MNKIPKKLSILHIFLSLIQLDLNIDIEDSNVWTNSEVKFAFVTWLESLLVSTAFITL